MREDCHQVAVPSEKVCKKFDIKFKHFGGAGITSRSQCMMKHVDTPIIGPARKICKIDGERIRFKWGVYMECV